jgi:G3E family GTPase
MPRKPSSSHADTSSTPMVKGRPRTPIPVCILTGFLGAGKTTLLSRQLTHPDMADTAVIINEFGDISLDHHLIETADEQIIELKGGCLCCQIRGDLVTTLEDLLRRRDNGRVIQFRRLVIETTGLADPAPVLHAIMSHPYLSLRYALTSVVTLVDALTGAETLNTHIESVRQIAIADLVALTKVDLVKENEQHKLHALEERLSSINPQAQIMVVDEVTNAPAQLFSFGLYDYETRSINLERWLKGAGLVDYEGAAHAHHHHDVNLHDERIKSFSILTRKPIPLSALEGFLHLLRIRYGPTLLRLKGIVHTVEEPARPVVIHAVQHVFHTPVYLSEWPDSDHSSRLVFITCDGDSGAIKALFDAFENNYNAEALSAIEPENPLLFPGAKPFRFS